jgi:NAD(P)-dependent dehydrogenase (short-subunit alcohol dehydrogenase family)
MIQRLEGKVAIVTGAGSVGSGWGNGRATAVRFAEEGDGRDTANAALFLASDEARFITGTEIVVDGGMTARCD